MVRMELTDKQIEDLSYVIDHFMAEQAVDYKISPASLTAIMTARLFHFNAAFGSVDDFKSILEAIAITKLPNQLH